MTQRAGAADVLRHERAHPLPQRAPDAAPAARLERRPGHQRERHDDDRRDLLRRQRLPRRAGRDPHRRRPARPAHRHRRPVHRRPAHRPGARRSSTRSPTSSAWTRIEIGHGDLAAGLGRHALEGRRGRDGHRRRDPGRHLQRPRRRRARHASSTAAPAGTRFPRPAGALLLVQALAALRQALARHGRRSTPAPRARCARAAPRCCRSGSSRSAAASTPATPSTWPRARRSIGKGISNYSAAELRQVMGMKSAQVREVLPRATEEAVHRDYFVLV